MKQYVIFYDLHSKALVWDSKQPLSGCVDWVVREHSVGEQNIIKQVTVVFFTHLKSHE